MGHGQRGMCERLINAFGISFSFIFFSSCRGRFFPRQVEVIGGYHTIIPFMYSRSGNCGGDLHAEKGTKVLVQPNTGMVEPFQRFGGLSWLYGKL